MKGLAGLMAIALLASPALAQDCSNASTQAQMNSCASEALEKADKDLNALYGQIRSRLKDDAAKTDLLAKAERAWVAFRDAECVFVASGVNGGSMQPMISASCRAELTRKRVEELKAYLACEEGDLSCPVPAGN